MGGKSSTSSQQVTIPPAVLARYNSVNATAEQAAQTPFQAYNGQFVAPLSQTQEAGVANTNTAAGQAQPYYQTATNTLMDAQQATSPYYQAATQALMSGVGQGASGTQDAYSSLYNANAAAQPLQQAGAYNMGQAYAGAQPYNEASAQGLGAAQQAGSNFTAQGYNSAQPYNALATGLGLAGAGSVNAQQIGGQQIGQFMSPYIQSVLQGTEGILNQQNQQAMSGQTGNAIMQGAFGGDRAGIAAANLSQQQQLANAQTYSGILNQGYNQALGAAQQQQGVNLSAAQANRAALQQASGQLAAIGQQQYGQGMGAGQQLFNQGLSGSQQLAAIGQQQYGQGMGLASSETGLGQQLFGQGATTSQQQAALAQQQYAQGLGGASALSGLGQSIYGTGAQTAQQLAALGSGAQSASLAGAQAQLSAGQIEQQTQQAQDTALYNQFLQQQSYPFQTAQFLANIAEGTGALSGSTTTTTQPGGLFSDARLKENIKPIGKTNDGQTIYSYNYKGDHRTQIGLLAQEVEKRHPEAVGLAGGYKTVDYAKATHDAERARRASGGGLVGAEHAYEGYADGGAPGFDPVLAQNMAASESGMFGPYGAAGGLGGQGRVPSANLPVGHLQTAGGLAPQKSGVEQGAQVASLIDSGIKDYGAAKKAFGFGAKPDTSTIKAAPSIDTSDAAKQSIRDRNEAIDPSKSLNADSLDLQGATPVGLSLDGQNFDGLPSWRGGLRGGYADGGMPYNEAGPSIDIPDEQKSTPQLATAQGSPGKGRSSMDDITNMAKIAAMIMANRGGRIGKDDGGSVDSEGNFLASAANDISQGLGSAGNWLLHGLTPEQQKQYGVGPQAALEHLRQTGAGIGAGIKQNLGVASQPDSAPQAPSPAPNSPAPTPQTPPQMQSDPIVIRPRYNEIQLNPPNSTGVSPVSAEIDSSKGPSFEDTGAPIVGAGPGNGPDPMQQHMMSQKGLGGADASAASANAAAATAAAATNNTGLAASHAQQANKNAATAEEKSKVGGAGMIEGALRGIGNGLAGAVGKPADSLLDAANDFGGNMIRGAGAGLKGYGSQLSQGDPNAWIPLLKGIATATAAPTRNFGVALAQGLGSAASAYYPSQQDAAKVQKTYTDIANKQALTRTQNVVTLADLSKIAGIKGMVPVVDPTNTSQYVVNGTHYKFIPVTQANGPLGAASLSAPRKYTYLDKNGGALAAQHNSDYLIAPDAAKAASDEAQRDAAAKAQAARDNLMDINQWAEALSANRTGPLQGGPLQGQATALVTKWNNMIAIAPLPDDAKAKLTVDGKGADAATVAQKMATAKAMGADAAVGQKSFSSLQQAMAATANGSMPRGAALQLAAEAIVKNQRDADRGAYYDEFNNEIKASGGLDRNYMATDANKGFTNAYSDPRYKMEQDKIQKWLEDGTYAKARQILASTGTDPKDVRSRELVTQRLKNAGMLRYFTGGTNGG